MGSYSGRSSRDSFHFRNIRSATRSLTHEFMQFTSHIFFDVLSILSQEYCTHIKRENMEKEEGGECEEEEEVYVWKEQQIIAAIIRGLRPTLPAELPSHAYGEVCG